MSKKSIIIIIVLVIITVLFVFIKLPLFSALSETIKYKGRFDKGTQTTNTAYCKSLGAAETNECLIFLLGNMLIEKREIDPILCAEFSDSLNTFKCYTAIGRCDLVIPKFKSACESQKDQ